MRKIIFAVVTAAALAGLAVGSPALALAAPTGTGYQVAPHKLGDSKQLDQCTVNLVRSGVALAGPLSQVELQPVYLTANC
jgi:hypothetical protein